MITDLEIIIRFLTKINHTGNCWEWKAHKRTCDGYSVFWLNGKNKLAHRFSYELFKGDVPEGLDLDHLCRNRSCVNPDHLEAVTRRENLLRSPITNATIHAKKTQCPQNHPYSEENTYLDSKNIRKCRTCHRIKSKIYYYKKRSFVTLGG